MSEVTPIRPDIEVVKPPKRRTKPRKWRVARNALGFQKTMIDQIVMVARGNHPSFPGALPGQSLALARIRSHAAAILIELRCGARPLKPARPRRRLRLVINNDSA